MALYGLCSQRGGASFCIGNWPSYPYLVQCTLESEGKAEGPVYLTNLHTCSLEQGEGLEVLCVRDVDVCSKEAGGSVHVVHARMVFRGGGWKDASNTHTHGAFSLRLGFSSLCILQCVNRICLFVYVWVCLCA